MKTPLLTEAKLVSAVHYMKNRIAPVPDGISVEVLKVVTTCYTQLLVHVYNECLAARIDLPGTMETSPTRANQ